MPRVKTDAERGYIGAWMRRERLRRDWSEDRVVQELARHSRQVRPDYIRALEAGSGGKKPSPELLAALVELYGSTPEALPEPALHDDENGRVVALNALVTAVAAQTEAMLAIAAEMRLARETTQGQSEALAEALGDLASTLARLQLAPAGKLQ